jgi:hypothetical protein
MKSFIVLALCSLSFAAVATSTSDTLLLKGNVPNRLSITLSAETIAANLPLDSSQTGTKIATVLEKSNSNTGYKVNISSANQGVLVRENGSEQFPYSLSYDGVSLDLSQSVEQVHSSASAVAASKDLEITYTGIDTEEMVEGNYTDTITFSIAAN